MIKCNGFINYSKEADQQKDEVKIKVSKCGCYCL